MAYKMRLIILIFCATSICGCSFTGRAWKTSEGWEWEANRPCVIKMPDGYECDGKTEPLINMKAPDMSILKAGA